MRTTRRPLRVSAKQTVPASELPSAAIQDGQLTVNHMNLGQDQEVQIHYQVRIKTEGCWLQA